MFAVPTVDQEPSMVAVLACTIASLEPEDPHAGVEQLGEVAARDPVGHDVVGLQRHQQPDVDAAARRRPCSASTKSWSGMK